MNEDFLCTIGSLVKNGFLYMMGKRLLFRRPMTRPNLFMCEKGRNIASEPYTIQWIDEDRSNDSSTQPSSRCCCKVYTKTKWEERGERKSWAGGRKDVNDGDKRVAVGG